MWLQKIASLPPQPERIWQCAIHPTLPLLATASSDKTAVVSSLRTYSPLSTVEGGHKRSIRTVAWKPNLTGESVLATGSFDATIGIWRRYERDVETETQTDADDDGDEEWRFALVLDGHESEVKSISWSPGGNLLATCSRDKTVWIWEEMDEDNFETIAVLQEHAQDVKFVAWHPEEELLASASYDDTVRLYREDVDDWGCCAVLRGHAATVWCVEFEKVTAPRFSAGRGARIATCSDDLSVRVWTRASVSGTVAGKEGKPAPPSILRGESVEEEWVQTCTLPRVHTRAIYTVSWSARSGWIASCGGDGRVVVYQEIPPAETEAESGPVHSEWKVIAELEGAHGVFEVNCVQWSKRWDKPESSDGSSDGEILISCGDDGIVNIWELVDDVVC